MNSHYYKIEKSLKLAEEKFETSYSVGDWASELNLGRTHFSNLFIEHTGISPAQYLRFLRLEKAKRLLIEGAPLLEATLASGYSGSGRLHDAFLRFEGMTPGEWKQVGEQVEFKYGVAETRLGPMLIVWTQRGIHRLEFSTDECEQGERISQLMGQFPKSIWTEEPKEAKERLDQVLGNKEKGSLLLNPIGTSFQIEVWKALLAIPEGSFSTYQRIAQAIGREKATRAVGTAIGANPIAYLIPCHRVIRKEGSLGGYRWGLTRKRLLLAKELPASTLCE